MLHLNEKKETILLHDNESEQELLGFLLLQNKNLALIDSIIFEDSFYFGLHKKIFKSIKYLIEKNYDADEKTVYHNIIDSVREEIPSEELKNYLERLVNMAVSSVSSFNAVTKIVKDLYLKRKLYDVSQNIKDYCTNNQDITNAVEQVEQEIYSISSSQNLSNHEPKIIDNYITKLKTKITTARLNHKDITGVKTNLIDLDLRIGGLQKSDLIILAARPSMGKTALAVTIARNIAKLIDKDENDPTEKGGVAFFSLEMSGEQISARIVSMEASISTKAIHTARKGTDNERISDLDFSNIIEVMNNLKDLKLYIDDTPAISIGHLRTRARYLKRKFGIACIFIDYLQLMQGSKKSDGNRVQEIAEITQGLKAIAKELEIPVVALSQLSRAVESRDDKRPQLSDLRDSGTIEQDADIVMFLYREAYYLERQEKQNINNTEQEQKDREKWLEKYEPIQNLAEVIIAKNRNGPIGIVNLFFNKETMEFINLQSNEILEKSKSRIEKTINIDKNYISKNDDVPDSIKKIFSNKS